MLGRGTLSAHLPGQKMTQQDAIKPAMAAAANVVTGQHFGGLLANACAAEADDAAAVRSSCDVEVGLETLQESEDRVPALQAELSAARAEVSAINERNEILQQALDAKDAALGEQRRVIEHLNAKLQRLGDLSASIGELLHAPLLPSGAARGAAAADELTPGQNTTAPAFDTDEERDVVAVAAAAAAATNVGVKRPRIDGGGSSHDSDDTDGGATPPTTTGGGYAVPVAPALLHRASSYGGSCGVVALPMAVDDAAAVAAASARLPPMPGAWVGQRRRSGSGAPLAAAGADVAVMMAAAAGAAPDATMTTTADDAADSLLHLATIAASQAGGPGDAAAAAAAAAARHHHARRRLSHTGGDADDSDGRGRGASDGSDGDDGHAGWEYGAAAAAAHPPQWGAPAAPWSYGAAAAAAAAAWPRPRSLPPAGPPALARSHSGSGGHGGSGGGSRKPSWFASEIRDKIPPSVQDAVAGEWRERGRIAVMCGDLRGSFFLNSGGELQIRLLSGASSGEVVSPNKFEEMAGKKTARNWQQSIRLTEYTMTGDPTSALLKLGHFTRIVGLTTDRS